MKIVIDGKTAEVSNGGPTYEAGDGITIQDNVLSVTTPVNTIITQSEFDALSIEQKSKGMYVIDDGVKGGYSSGSSMEIYDDQERVIGTWFGKPLYRKIILHTLPTETGEWTLDYDFTDVDAVVKIYSTNNTIAEYHSSVSTTMSGYSGYNNSASQPDIFSIYVDRTRNVFGGCLGTPQRGGSIFIFFEYTKTTDQGVTP